MHRILSILWCCLLHEGRDLDPESLGELIDQQETRAMVEAVQECLRLSTVETPTANGKRPKVQSDWPRLWSYGIHDLRLTDGQFWSLTPRQFQALSDRHEDAMRRALHPGAMVCSTLANLHRDPKKRPEPFTPADFLPALQIKADPERPKKIEAVKDIATKTRELFASIGTKTVHVKPWSPF